MQIPIFYPETLGSDNTSGKDQLHCCKKLPLTEKHSRQAEFQLMRTDTDISHLIAAEMLFFSQLWFTQEYHNPIGSQR